MKEKCIHPGLEFAADGKYFLIQLGPFTTGNNALYGLYLYQYTKMSKKLYT